MKNFKSGGFKKEGSGFKGRASFSGGDRDRRPAGRYDAGRPSRDERGGDKPELFKTTCTTCGKPCEVPFRPDGVKPVLCRDCFAAKNAYEPSPTKVSERFTPNERIGRRPEREFSAPAPRPVVANTADYALLVKQLGAVEVKVNQILQLIKASEKLVVELPIVAPAMVTEGAVLAPTKVRKPKLATPAVKKAAVKKKVAKKAAVAKKVAKKEVVAKKAPAAKKTKVK